MTGLDRRIWRVCRLDFLTTTFLCLYSSHCVCHSVCLFVKASRSDPLPREWRPVEILINDLSLVLSTLPLQFYYRRGPLSFRSVHQPRQKPFYRCWTHSSSPLCTSGVSFSCFGLTEVFGTSLQMDSDRWPRWRLRHGNGCFGRRLVEFLKMRRSITVLECVSCVAYKGVFSKVIFYDMMAVCVYTTLFPKHLGCCVKP